MGSKSSENFSTAGNSLWSGSGSGHSSETTCAGIEFLVIANVLAMPEDFQS